MAAVPKTLPAEASDVAEAIRLALPGALEEYERRTAGMIDRAMNRAIGAQQTMREETLEQRVKRWRGFAMTAGVAAAVVAIAVGAAITTLRTYWGTAEKAAEAKAAPLEQRVQDGETRLDAIENDISDIGRTLSNMGRTLDRIDRRTTVDDEDEQELPRRRPR